MALNIFSTTTSSTNSSSQSPKQSTGASSATDLFATHLANPATRQPTPHKVAKSKQSATHKQHTDKTASSDNADQTRADQSTKSASQSDSSGSQSGDATTTSEEGSAAANASGANGTGTAKGARTANTKAGTPQTATQQAGTDNTTDPSADQANSSGLSMLQLLARTLGGKDSGKSATTDTTGPATSDQSNADGNGTDATSDPNALALAMMSQALAASFAGAAAPAGSAATQAANASQAAGNAAAGVGDATSGTTAGTSAQQLISILAQDIAAGAKGKSDADAVQSDVAATKGASDGTGDASAAGNTTPDAQSIAQSFAQLGATSHFSRDTNTAELKAPVGSPAWNEELGGQLIFMSHKGLESGSLRVSPEHLGPVEVQISVQNGDASVWFGANHPDTRAALEQALPKLREMFANQGLTLTDSGVSREPPRNQSRPSAPPAVTSVSAIGSSEGASVAASRVSLGLIDTYA